MNKLLLYYQRTTEIADNLSYKKAAEDQEIFVRNDLGFMLQDAHIFVVSQHKSKSIDLPVYGILVRNGLSILLRNNFYKWIVSVKLPHKINNHNLPKNLIQSGWNDNGVYPSYCDGFTKEQVYGPYISNDVNCTEFTVAINDNYKLYTLLYLINNMLNNSVISVDNDTRTAEDIHASIDSIYKENGVYEIDKEGYNVMYEYEVLTNTFAAIEDVLGHDIYEIMKDKDRLVKCIMRYPEVKYAFMLDEYMFNYKF